MSHRVCRIVWKDIKIDPSTHVQCRQNLELELYIEIFLYRDFEFQCIDVSPNKGSHVVRETVELPEVVLKLVPAISLATKSM